MERLRDLDEAELLARVLPLYAAAVAPDDAALPVGPGDDAAVLETPSGTVVATTDGMVRGRDWRDDWSSAHDVGVKVTVQNLADVAAMGAVPTGLLVSLVADPDTAVDWVLGLADGIAAVSRESGAPVVGGDLSSGPAGVVTVTLTALGDLRGRRPVRRSGAQAGDVVAVCGTLGTSGGGLALYLAGRSSGGGTDADLLRAAHRAPRPPWEAGPVAADVGAHALVDVSDGLVTDLGRVARASRVGIDLSGEALRTRFARGPLERCLGADEALRQVLGGGEEHSLVGCFPASVDLGALPGRPWVAVGRVVETGPDGARVTVDGVVPDVRGWDHFAGA
ncbi:thiamine-phosphate kinase [Phycicoccus sp. MAQZ13P-2]|uniref:thiamine-phosphate kinase n=1 Tax=Phycicoccus mangrovi TaxID=2840470 RepID=UPI001C004D6C|nr:thiamine-phosphate kinase [Phycicoccus mangrovi]MBT9254324.1 thiamine-phosphate kinase [Phycicoccus mangrovi]MBT9272702.1 thiamine-phosphate kinase [Phycicoccus mangrovi]